MIQAINRRSGVIACEVTVVFQGAKLRVCCPQSAFSFLCHVKFPCVPFLAYGLAYLVCTVLSLPNHGTHFSKGVMADLEVIKHLPGRAHAIIDDPDSESNLKCLTEGHRDGHTSHASAEHSSSMHTFIYVQVQVSHNRPSGPARPVI